MKKIVITLGVLFAASTAFTQGAYATLGLGYAGASTSEQLGEDINTVGTATTETNINGTNGAGIPIHLNAGYMLSEHFGVELGFSYLLGSELTVNSFKSDAAIVGALTSDITTTKGSSLRIAPRLVMSTNAFGLNLYSKLGIIIPVAGKTTYEITSVRNGSPDITTVMGGESTGSFSIGFNGAIGASFEIGNNLSIFGELDMINLRIKSATRTITSAKSGGTDILSTLPKSKTHTEFVDEIPSSYVPTPTEAYKALGTSSNYSSFGINVGVKMAF